MFARWKFQIALIAVIAILAILAGAFRGERIAYAQEGDRDYVDVGLILEAPEDHLAPLTHNLDVIVVNNGSRTAYDVKVVADVVSPDPSHLGPGDFGRRAGVPKAPVGRAYFDGTSLIWTIPTLEGLQRELLTVQVRHENVSPSFDNEEKPHEIFGTVTTASFESDLRKENNTARVWTYTHDGDGFLQVGVNYTVDVSVDKWLPERGDTVNFTVTASRKQTHGKVGIPPLLPNIPPPIDLEVAIELTSGLTAGTPSSYHVINRGGLVSEVTSQIRAMFPSTLPVIYNAHPPGSGKPRGGVFNIGTGHAGAGHGGTRDTSHSVTLPVTVGSGTDVVVNEQCLTAKLTGNPPPGTGRLDDDEADNVAKLCLGTIPPYFTSADLQEFVSHPCVGNSNHPCDSTDDVRVRAIYPEDSAAVDPLVLSPGTPVIVVPDTSETRRFDGDTNSVNAATKVSWQVPVQISYDPYTSDHPRWKNIVHSFSYEMPGKDNFDKLHIRVSWGTALLNDGRRKAQFLAWAPGSSNNGPFLITAEFEKLGTYKVNYDITATHDNNTPSDTADDVEYPATGSYIFHVGPIADLGVRDGGASPYVAAGSNALTIVAGNNSPEDSWKAQVTGLPTGAEVLHVSHGAYNATTGEWDIGELWPGGYYSLRGEHEPTLVLSADAGDTANVSIAISENYEVCIGSDRSTLLVHTTEAACVADTTNGGSWHEGTVYDYNAANNTATITAAVGIGGGDSAPASVTVIDPDASGVLVEWSAVAQVNGLHVTHYELQRMDSSWTTVAPKVTETIYLDKSPGSDNPDYRVRAVNAAGVPGPWSQTAGRRPGVPQDFTATGVSDAQARLSWSAPAAVDGVTVTGYDLHFSTDGGNTWTSLAAEQSATTYTHTDSTLAAGATRQYRVRAVGMVGSKKVKSGWVLGVATADYLTPGAPRNFIARPVNESRVDLSWSAPEAVADVTITGYHLDFSTDGNTWNWLPAGPSRTALTATTHAYTHTDDTLSPGAIRQYRVRSVGTGAGNATFESPWVFGSATTEEVGAPQNLNAAADGRNRIDLTWDLPAFGADLITGYRIDYTPASPEQWQTLESGYGTNPRRYEHAGLLPAERYCYRVAAIYPGGTGPFSARACATTAGAPTDLPGEPENLRVAQLGSNYVTLEWDAPSVGGAVEYYEYRYNNGAAVAVSPLTATRVRVGGLQPGSHYQFQARAGNAYGPGAWSQPIQVNLHRAGEAARATPQELEVEKGGSGSFNVRLNRSPQWPLRVTFYAEGPDCLTQGLAGQQGKILLPTNPPPSKAFWDDIWWGPPEDRWAQPWNVGLDIQVDASGCQGGETAVVEYDLYTLPFSQLEGSSLWDYHNLNEDEWREKWGTDPLDGTSGPSVKVAVSDGGVSGQQSSPGAAGEPTSVTLALDAATVSEGVGQVIVTATLDGPAPEGGIGGFLLAGEDGTASEDIDFAMPLDIFIPGGQRSATATISITDDDLDEADETVVLSALFDIGTALLEDKITLTITDDDTAGVTVTAANPVRVIEGESATYTVVLDSRPTAAVTIEAASSDPGAAGVTPASHTFTPDAWNTPATFTVSGVSDEDTEDETVGVSHGVSSQDAKYAAALVSSVAVSVTDNTQPGQQQGQANQAPTVSAAIGDITIVNESRTHEVSLSGVFDDADNDSLTVTAASSAETVATVSVASDYSSLTVAAKSRGTASITATAADGNGGTVSDTFTVTVKAAPTVASALGDVSLEEGGSQDISLSGVFSDADGDALTLSAASSNDEIVSAFEFRGTLTIVAVSAGSATITVTARDADGNRVSDAFDVSVAAQQQQQQQEPPPNQAPTVASAIADATIVHESGRHEVSLSRVFSDADNDALTITAASSDETKATASVASDYSTLTVSAKARGTATITVTAADGNGGTVSDTFTVTVKAAPTVALALGDVSLEEGGSQDISLSGVFSDADGDTLTITATSSDDDKATVSVATDGSALTLTGVAQGTATITVTAQDADGNRASDAFDVSVAAQQQQQQQDLTPNQAPTVSAAIGDITMVHESGTEQVSLSGVFDDADNDSLTVTAASSADAVATVSVASDYSSLTVAAKSRGTATITATAADGNGGTVSDTFTVTVKAAPVVSLAIGDVSGLEVGTTQDVSLSGVFSDADGDTLTITATSSDDAKTRVSVASDGSKLTLSGVAQGTATITVTARDADGNTVNDTFDVTAVKAPDQEEQELVGWGTEPPPANVQVVPGDGTLTVSWTVTPREDVDDDEIKHALRWSQASGVWHNPKDHRAGGAEDGLSVAGGVTSYVITGLKNGVATGVFVRAFTGRSYSERSEHSSKWVRTKGEHTTPRAE